MIKARDFARKEVGYLTEEVASALLSSYRKKNPGDMSLFGSYRGYRFNSSLIVKVRKFIKDSKNQEEAEEISKRNHHRWNKNKLYEFDPFEFHDLDISKENNLEITSHSGRVNFSSVEEMRIFCESVSKGFEALMSQVEQSGLKVKTAIINGNMEITNLKK